MFTLFERLLKPTAPPEQAVPPPGFVAYFWHFARQAKGLFAALFAAGLVVALLDSTVPVFMGRIVTLITAGSRTSCLRNSGPTSWAWRWCC
jgi:ATP-binding cassette subfamily B multidrug efflux pump